MGLWPIVSSALSNIVPSLSTHRYPADPGFGFQEFYSRLSEMGFVICLGKLGHDACFRLGTIGRLNEQNMKGLLREIAGVMDQMKQPSIQAAWPGAGAGKSPLAQLYMSREVSGSCSRSRG